MRRSVLVLAAVLAAAGCSSHGGGSGAAAAGTLTAKCDLHAPGITTPTIPEGDFPPADVTAPRGGKSMTAKQAVEDALVYGTSASGTKPPASDATATEVTYAASQRSLQESDPRIAPSRCVWLVKVNAPLQFHTGPPGLHVHPAPAYSVLYDVNSKFMFELVPQYGPSTSAP